MSRLIHFEKSIKDLMALIPAKHYLPSDDQDNLMQSKFIKNKKQDQKDIKTLARKAKISKLDPEALKSIEEIQQEQVETVEKPAEIQPMRATSIAELKERLRKRIADLQLKRNKVGDSKKEILERRQKSKEQKKNSKHQKKELVSDIQEPVQKKQKITQDIQYGLVDFGLEERKKGPTDTLGKLKKAEKQQQKLAQMPTQVQDSAKWTKLMSLAQGQKIKDDPALLKKTLKREQKQKEKSQKEWQQRKEALEKKTQEKQKRRTENLQKRPGFEGSKRRK